MIKNSKKKVVIENFQKVWEYDSKHGHIYKFCYGEPGKEKVFTLETKHNFKVRNDDGRWALKKK